MKIWTCRNVLSFFFTIKMIFTVWTWQRRHVFDPIGDFCISNRENLRVLQIFANNKTLPLIFDVLKDFPD